LPPAKSPTAIEAPGMGIEDWEDETISKVMLVTLDVLLQVAGLMIAG
jgi:hypothetical protein